MFGIKNWLRRRVIEDTELPDDVWRWGLENVPLTDGLTDDDLARLRELTILFLHEKTFDTAADLELDGGMCLVVAIQACLPILNLGWDAYRGWSTVILYPGQFRAPRTHTDELGIEHEGHADLAGEAWLDGPLILSWDDIDAGLDARDGFNVVIHECAHKLDMLDGDANGMPPLHADMDFAAWTRDLSVAYDDLCARVDRDEDTAIDPYAATSPGEFFAVLSEAFFEVPHLFFQEYPAVYRQFQAFYRQDPRETTPSV